MGDEVLVVQCIEIARAAGLVPVLVATASPVVRDACAAEGLPVVGPGPELAIGLDEQRADVLFSIANLRVVPDDVLARVDTAINFHDGPLPAYAGLNVTTWAILDDQREHAVTWHLMTAEVDAGQVIATEQFPIGEEETAFSLNARCYEAALATFPRVVAGLSAGDLPLEPQPPGERRTFLRHQRPAVLVDPGTPAAATARAVRALDLGNRTTNRIGRVRWLLGDEAYVVEAASAPAGPGSAAPGTVAAIGEDGLRLATVDGDLLVHAVSTPEGETVDLVALAARHGLDVGAVVPAPTPEQVAALRELEPELAVTEERWLDRLADAHPSSPALAGAPGGTRETRTIDLPAGVDRATAVSAAVLWLARTTGADTVGVGITEPSSRAILERLAPLARPGVLVVPVSAESRFEELRSRVVAELDAAGGRPPLLRDAIGRDPRTRGRVGEWPVLFELDAPGPGRPSWAEATQLRVVLADSSLVLDAPVDPADPGALDRAAEQLATLVAGAVARPDARCDEIPLLGPAETALLDAVNGTDLDHDRSVTIDGLFRAQVARTPDAAALSFGSVTLTYRELHERVRSLATRLTGAGVGRGDRVGIATERGIEMVVSVLATLEVGASYVPLDPTYPGERLTLMAEDAGIVVLLAAADVADRLCPPHVVPIDPAHRSGAAGDVVVQHDPCDLAYVIYTSGSTGVPKGVMLEHRQVVNFFAAMDQVIDRDPPGVWLAVTSLSFDISVLELLWTLTRGFHVVLKADRGVPAVGSAASTAPGATRSTRPISFSLFYFAAGEDAASDGYRLLLESARFADRHGFEAVWTPERHFHAFGGAYPNPSVTGAALAAVTENVGIRAGSVVLPLHSPIRVAEEWAVVDNLSRGRVALSFAAGWQPNDFVLNPSAYATAKEDLPRSIDAVRRLWRGESVALPGHDGEPVETSTLPRPVQPELPVWLTSAGTPATFERAGRLGMNVLTHLLGQSVEQVAENIERYRAAWREAGHEGEGRVTLMLHTFLHRDADAAREVAREPMKGYLRTSVGLLRNVATAFPIFADAGKDADDLLASLSADELDQLLEMAAQRYLGASGLFGTPEDAAAMVEELAEVGVDEVACLVDFGISTDEVLSSLDLLLEAKHAVDERRRHAPSATTAPAAPAFDPQDDTVAALTARHRVTHLQCTPSLAAMLTADPADRRALETVGHLMLGGEALPAALAADLRALLPGRFTNMYGPTETTIWSLTHELADPPGASVPIGRPIANTTVFVLDGAGRRVPLGTYGELHLGGEGVARGYHNRPELTAERFVDRPGMGRVYATGDIVRILPSGIVEFAGRVDNQVKVRGHRIELGEIEAALDRHPAVSQSVVVAEAQAGDVRLAAYVVLEGGRDASPAALRQHVADALPAAMVPSTVVPLEAFPLTPNGKVDRKALGSGDFKPAVTGTTAVSAPPVEGAEELVASIWSDELGCPVGRDDNFFDIGGQSLLAVKVFRRISEATDAPLALTDVFRFPTVRSFAAHLDTLQGSPAGDREPQPVGGPSGVDRGAMRRRALTRRGRGGTEDGA